MSKQSRFSLYFLPLGIFIVLALFLWRGLALDPRLVPSTLIGQKAPGFHVTTLFKSDHYLNDKDLQGQVSLLNVWATWCETCRSEHPVLLAIAQTKKVALYGLDYKDKREEAKRWLQKWGNPYHDVAFDEAGKVAIDWGVYGTPETFLIDKQGIIRYKHVGPLTMNNWQNEILPLIDQLSNR